MALPAVAVPGVALGDGGEWATAAWCAAPVGMALLRPDGRVLSANPALCELLGRPEEVLVGRGLGPASHPNDAAQFPAFLERLARGATTTHEQRYLRADGSVLRARLRAAATRDRAGDALVVLAFEEVTDHHRASEVERASDERFRALVRHVSEVVMVVASDGTVSRVSPAASVLMGYDPAEMLGASAFAFVHPDDAGAAADAFARVADLTYEGPQVVGMRARHADGSWRDVEVVATNHLDDPSVGGIVLTVRDVTARKRAEEELRASEERLRAVVDSSPDAILRFDRQLRVTYANPAVLAAAGAPPEVLVGRGVRELGLRAHLAAAWEDCLGRVFATGQDHDLELEHDLDGGSRWLWARLAPERGAAGAVDHVVAIVRDVTARKEAEAHLATLATRDPLTGLANRALLLDRLGHTLTRAARSKRSLAVLFCDLDRFKAVNDSLGHHAGDELLCAVAARLARAARAGDTVARFGGDEFVVLCEDVTEEEAVAMAERVLGALATPFSLRDEELLVDVSIGVAVSADARTSPEALVRDADAAMYEAKARGRGRFELFGGRARRSAGPAPG